MEFPSHHAYDSRKLLKLGSFCRPEWIRLEKRDDHSLEVRQISDAIPVEVLAVVVVTAIDEDITASEKPL